MIGKATPRAAIASSDRHRLKQLLSSCSPHEVRTLKTGWLLPKSIGSSCRAGMWLFLGVEIDPPSFSDVSVSLLEIGDELLLVEIDTKRVLCSVNSELDLASWLKELQIEIQWSVTNSGEHGPHRQGVQK